VFSASLTWNQPPLYWAFAWDPHQNLMNHRKWMHRLISEKKNSLSYYNKIHRYVSSLIIPISLMQIFHYL
jgi:hypothetical protein